MASVPTPTQKGNDIEDVIVVTPLQPAPQLVVSSDDEDDHAAEPIKTCAPATGKSNPAISEDSADVIVVEPTPAPPIVIDEEDSEQSAAPKPTPAAVNKGKPNIDPTPEDTSANERSSLGLLAGYGSGSDGSDEEDSDDDVEITAAPAPAAQPPAKATTSETHAEATRKLDQFLEAGDYRVISDSSEDDDDDDDEETSDDEVVEVVGAATDNGTAAGSKRTARARRQEADDGDDSDVEIVSKSREYVKAKGEMGIDDLPPIEDLKISVPEDQCVLQGKVISIVEQLVLVDSVAGSQPLDLDTVLFLDKGNTALGRVFDVLGQVAEPLYCVRFNSNEEILERGITVGTAVFVAPRTEHTTFVILGNLMREKGCDASWEHDVEPPARCMEFSDDEEERNARKVRRGKKKGSDADGAGADGDEDGDTPHGGGNDDGQKRQRNASVSSEQSGFAATAGGSNAPAENWRLPQRGGGRFQRGGGRGGAAGGQRGGSGGYGAGGRGGGGYRGQQNQQYAPHQQHHSQQSHRSYGHPSQQQHGQHAGGNNWTAPRDYSWHTNLPYNGPPAGLVQPPPAGYYGPPPQQPQPHLMHPYGVNGAVGGGYVYHAGPQAPPMPYGGYAGPQQFGPQPPMVPPPQHYQQPPQQQQQQQQQLQQQQPLPPGYQQLPLPQQQQQKRR